MYPSRWGSISSWTTGRPSMPYMMRSVPSGSSAWQRAIIHSMNAAASPV